MHDYFHFGHLPFCSFVNKFYFPVSQAMQETRYGIPSSKTISSKLYQPRNGNIISDSINSDSIISDSIISDNIISERISSNSTISDRISINFSDNNRNGSSDRNTSVVTSSLQIYLWKVFPDMALFDWYISLEEKSRYGKI